MKHIPLLPRHGICLICLEGDAERFADAFRDVWGEIPLAARRRLLKYWRDNNPFQDQDFNPPVVTLESKETNTGLERAHAYCTFRGMQLYFRNEWFARSHTPAISATIAHELAHAYHISQDTKEERHSDLPWHVKETITDDLARQWGFWLPMRNYKRMKQRK